jgi:fatty acid desaturase
MKLERERDIPAFQGKNWRERVVLRHQAEERDPWILRLRLLIYFLCFMPTLSLAAWLGFGRSWLALFVICMVFSLPVSILLEAMFVTPRIRRALESDAKPSA